MNIIIKRKNIKNINLRVKTDLTVHASFPMHCSDKEIKDFIESKEEWINEVLEKFRKAPTPKVEKKEYKDGEGVKFLGIEYKLKILNKMPYGLVYPEEKSKIMYITVKNNSTINERKSIIEEFQRSELERIIDMYIRPLNEKYSEKDKITVKYKYLKSKWGSCNFVKKILTFNYHLIERSFEEIKYVLIHEVVHLDHHGHDKTFYSAVEDIMPDWKKYHHSLKGKGE